ncbi:MAG: undecaprenyl-diphosphatase UppP [Anaerolineae bacterium]|nr:undecaprenyl-diphosphatase UppP [Anaerolineae bacterium]
MDLLQAIILGLVQGATEYIPVSSSAHLILVPWLLGWPDPSFEFEVLVQWGTLIGVFIFFWQDIWGIAKAVLQALAQGRPFATFEARLGWFVVIATIPAVVLGLLFKDFFEAAFAAPAVAGGLLILTAILLTIAEMFGSRARALENMKWLDALIIGFWQAAAILPGISRSGSTIGGAVIQGFNRTDAARFSFLMSIPALVGAGLVALVDLLGEGTLAAQLPAISVGFIAAAISGYVCIRWLLHYLQRHSLYVFAIYCAALSILSIVVGLVRG